MTVQRKEFIAFVGVRAGLDSVLDWLKKQNISALLISPNISLQEALTYDYCVDMDPDDEQGIIKAIEELPPWVSIKCFYTTNEYRVPSAARLADYFGWGKPVNLVGAINCRNKKNIIKILVDNGLSHLGYKLVSNPKDVIAASMSLEFPVIVKPSNEAGSRFVFKCDDMVEASDAVVKICEKRTNYVGQKLDPEILIEEMAEGPEYSVEACTVDGETKVISVTEKVTSGPPSFIEQAHQVPAILDASLIEDIEKLIIKSHEILSIDNVVTHSEFKLTKKGPEIIEINGRPGGDHIPELVKSTTGICLSELGAHIALGGNLTNYERNDIEAESAAVKFFIASNDGVVSYQKEYEKPDNIQNVVISVPKGGLVIKTIDNYTRLGYVKGISNHGPALDVIEEFLATLTFDITPVS